MPDFWPIKGLAQVYVTVIGLTAENSLEMGNMSGSNHDLTLH
jgi:hypothetical protein